MIDWKIVTYVTEQRFKKWVRRAVGGYVILVLGLGYAIWGINNDRGQRRVELAKDNAVQISAVRAAAVSNCNNNFTAVQNTRAVLKTFDRLTTAQYRLNNIPRVQYRNAHSLYLRLIDSLELPDCRKVAKLVTTAPRTPIAEVAPKYAE